MWFVFLCCSLSYCIMVLQPSNFTFIVPRSLKKLPTASSRFCQGSGFFIAAIMDRRSWDSLAFLGLFTIQTGPTPTNNRQQTMLDACIQNFSQFQLCIGWRGEGWGGRENCKKISKRMHSCKREPRHDRKIWILQHCPKDFFLGLWVKATQG